MSLEQDVWSSLQNDLELHQPQDMSEETILAALRLKVSELLQKDAGSFFQFMYRLDIPEDKMNDALHAGEQTIDQLASVIYNRQVQKAKTRALFKNKDNVKDDELSW